MSLDLLMLVRETIFLLLAIPTILFSAECLIRLRKTRIAASRIFLREELVLTAFRNLLTASIITIPASLSLFLWSIFEEELFRLTTAILFVMAAVFVLTSSYRLRNVLMGES